MARKPKHEEHENLERWLVSYADFITLLFAFFVVMYAISSVNEGKYRVLSDSLVAAFQSPAKSMEPVQLGEVKKSQGEAKMETRDPIQLNKQIVNNQLPNTMVNVDAGNVSDNDGVQAINRMADKIEKALSDLITKDLIAVKRNELWIEVEIKTSILFPSGSAVIQTDAVPILQSIAEILRDFKNPIRVEGFTDNVPINTAIYPSNWELSAGRAASVVHLFQGSAIDPTRMAAIGYGEYWPSASNDTPEGRSQNRKVVIVILESEDAERIFSQRIKNRKLNSQSQSDSNFNTVSGLRQPVGGADDDLATVQLNLAPHTLNTQNGVSSNRASRTQALDKTKGGIIPSNTSSNDNKPAILPPLESINIKPEVITIPNIEVMQSLPSVNTKEE